MFRLVAILVGTTVHTHVYFPFQVYAGFRQEAAENAIESCPRLLEQQMEKIFCQLGPDPETNF